MVMTGGSGLCDFQQISLQYTHYLVIVGVAYVITFLPLFHKVHMVTMEIHLIQTFVLPWKLQNGISERPKFNKE